MNIIIRGVQKTSLIDYPKNVCSVVFVGKCNFRCPYCHNPELVLEEIKEEINPEEVIEFLKKRKRWIDAACITGGEPTLHKGLPQFIERIKELGLKVKLDTNGTNPKMLKELIDRNLLDYIAMDIKASPEKYSKASGVNANIESIKSSAVMIMKSGIRYEFRTTVVPGLFDEKEAEKISKWLKEAEKFCLQQFRNEDRTLDRGYNDLEPYRPKIIKELRDIMKKNIQKVEIRGL